jgi:chromatin remodeling complex protein RSC6
MSDNIVNKDTTIEDEITDGFSGLLSTLGTFRTQITMLQNQIRILEKGVNKKVKGLQKEAAKNKSRGNRKPSGFAVPTNVTPELCEFMGKPSGTMLARTEVTQYIIGYIRENELQNAQNKKCIAPDNKLNKLLDTKDGDEITYFNIQRYMNKHFIKE